MMKIGPAARVAIAASVFGLTLPPSPARAQDSASHLDALQQLNGSVATLVKRVSQSVVQVIVTSYGPVDQANGTNTDLVIGHQRSMGSGVVIASGGYIVTNAHVVSNARQVQVVLPGAATDAGGVRSLVKGRGRTVDATIVGVAREVDLALLKVDDEQLPALPVADYDTLRQGELVFAFGSPEGLRNSVTMGIVSAVARQDGEPLGGLPRLAFHLFTHSAGDRITLGVRRGSAETSCTLTVSERPHDFDRLTDLVDPENSLVAKLGILGVDITDATAGLAASVRIPSGVVVVGHTTNETQFTNAGLMTADTIHAINNQSVTSVTGLRAAVDAMKPRSPVVLQIERSGQFHLPRVRA